MIGIRRSNRQPLMEGFYAGLLAGIAFDIVIVPDVDPGMLLMGAAQIRILAIETITLAYGFQTIRRSLIDLVGRHVSLFILIDEIVDVVTNVNDGVNIIA